MKENLVRKKLIVCGDGGVGKTAMLMIQSGQSFPEEYVPTVFENYNSKILVGNKVVELSLWDTAGQEDYNRIRPLSYPDTDVILLCFAICNRDSFHNLETKWCPELKHFLPNVPKILIGCKSDLRHDPYVIKTLGESNQHPITQEEGLEKMSQIGAYKYFECSAKTGEGIKEIFQAAAKASLKRQRKKLMKCKMM